MDKDDPSYYSFFLRIAVFKRNNRARVRLFCLIRFYFEDKKKWYE